MHGFMNVKQIALFALSFKINTQNAVTAKTTHTFWNISTCGHGLFHSLYPIRPSVCPCLRTYHFEK